MRKIYGFRTEDEAVRYADKNYMSGSYQIVETNSGNYAIKKLAE